MRHGFAFYMHWGHNWCSAVTKTDRIIFTICSRLWAWLCVMAITYPDKTVQLVSVSFSHLSAFHCILSHCMDESLFVPPPLRFILQTEGLFKWLRSTKRDWDDGWGRVQEDRGRSVREGTKTTPSDCRWLFQSLAWIWAFTETSAGLFSGDTGRAFIEWMMMLKWSFHFSLSLWWPFISKATQNFFFVTKHTVS